MLIKTRAEQFHTLFPREPSFRWRQIEVALFSARSWSRVTTLPDVVKKTLSREIPWFSYRQSSVINGHDGKTHKAALTLPDGELIETVLMANGRGQWTVCVSSQVGCAMGCNFCLTGTMGLKRNLTSDEIVDQYRFWADWLRQQGALSDRISNLVIMGMGEPMLNYDQVKQALITFLQYTDIGPTHITVSSVGVMAGLRKVIDDPDWPAVRLAISLHSADPVVRKQLIPTSPVDFLAQLTDWVRRYEKRFESRSHYLTFEYIMIAGINDSMKQAALLARLVNKLGHIKVNLIPYNMARQAAWQGSTDAVIREFARYLKKHGVTATQRNSLGNDIQAACGQLVVKKQSSEG